MKNVLYVGNALSNSGKNVTSVETLGKRLEEICNIKTASSKSNKTLRLIDMMGLVIKNASNTDVVLIDTYSTLNFYFAFVISLLCRLFNLDYIPILHGGNLEYRLKNNPKLSHLLFNKAKCLVSPSKFLKSKFEALGYQNIYYIPNFISIENYDFFNREIDTIKLLWVRAFSEIYNPELAVSTLEILINKGYNAELTMVGPEIDGAFKSIKTLSFNKNLSILMPGKLSKNEWINLSKSHNVFINTTNYDNAPVSIVEAMALGLPVVSTNVGGLPYLIENNTEGILVKPNDAELMAEAIIQLQKDKNLKEKLVCNARRKAETFDWQSVKLKWKSLL